MSAFEEAQDTGGVVKGFAKILEVSESEEADGALAAPEILTKSASSEAWLPRGSPACPARGRTVQLKRTKSANSRLLRERIMAIARAELSKGDVWAKHEIHTLAAERVVRHRYDPRAREWRVTESVVKCQRASFDEGAMRRCYRAKKLAFGYVRRWHSLDWKKMANYVLKEYKQAAPGGAEEGQQKEDPRAFDDVRWQMEASLWADRFNHDLDPPKHIKMIDCFVLEFVDRPGKPTFCAERFIDGHDTYGKGFVKHNNNSGYVDESEHRLTPQAFSNYSFYASEGDVLVCDIQGVEDLYTDPQLHTAAQTHGDGDLGRRGMALFFASCSFADNPLMQATGLEEFPLTAVERRRCSKSENQKRNRRKSKIQFAETELFHLARCDDALKERKQELVRFTASSDKLAKQRVFGDPQSPATCDATAMAVTEAGAAMDAAMDAGALALAHLVQMNDGDDDFEDAGASSPRSGAFAPAAKTKKLEKALGEVHSALARLECEGRWTEGAPDAASALFHAATAALLGDPRAAFALARWHQSLTHHVLPAAPGHDLDLKPPLFNLDDDDGDDDDNNNSNNKAAAADRPRPDPSARDSRNAGALLALATCHNHRAAASALALALTDHDSAAAFGLGTKNVDAAARILDDFVFNDDTNRPANSNNNNNTSGPASSSSSSLTGEGGNATPGAAFKIGDQVEADFGAEGFYYPATIADVNGDATYELNYHDGEAESSVPAERIRRTAATAQVEAGNRLSFPSLADDEDEDAALALPPYELLGKLGQAYENDHRNELAARAFKRAADLAQLDATAQFRLNHFLGRAASLGA